MFLFFQLFRRLRELEESLVIKTHDLFVLLGQDASLLAAVQDSDHTDHQFSQNVAHLCKLDRVNLGKDEA
jgi:hypothetical protein